MKDDQIIRHFDRAQWLSDKEFLTRNILFLDLKFWIGMSEGRDARYRELRRLLSEMVAANRIICTLSPSLLLEVKKRPRSDKRTESCRWMDKFSQGLSIRNWPTVFKEEFISVAEGIELDRSLAYSHFIEALSAGLRVVFDPIWPDAEADRAAKMIFDWLDKRSVVEMVDIEVSENQEDSIISLRDGLTELAREEQQWREANPTSADAIEQAEFAATVNAVLPQIFDATFNVSPPSFFKLLSTSMDEKAEMLKQCPTFWCKYKLMSALRSNRMRINENDLWDLEHVAVALPHVDCLASDKGTRHLCTEMLQLDEKYGTRVVSSVGDLIEWVRGC